jgi:CRP/FNR family transcriptional regulator, cyclic AMP receptor protein
MQETGIFSGNRLFTQLREDEVGLWDYTEVRKGDYFYFGKESVEKLYFIRKGLVKIGFAGNGGMPVIKDILSAGDLFGQLSLEQVLQRREYAQAITNDVSVCVFSINHFRALLSSDAQLALSYMVQVNQQKIVVENRLYNLLTREVRYRLIDLLLYLLGKSGVETGPGQYRMPAHLTHEELAGMIASSRQTVTTCLNALSREGLLEFDRKKILIPDIAILRKAALQGVN